MWLQSHERGLCLQDAAHARSKAHHAQSSVLAVCCQGLVSSSPWRLQPLEVLDAPIMELTI